MSALEWACWYGRLEIVKFLLQDKGADPSEKNNSPILLASEYGHLEVVKFLLQDKRVDPTARDNFAIRMAKEYDHTEVVEELLKDVRVKNLLDRDHARLYSQLLRN